MEWAFEILCSGTMVFLLGGLVLLFTMGLGMQVAEHFRKKRGPLGVEHAARILGLDGRPDSRGRIEGQWRGSTVRIAPEDGRWCHLEVEAGLPIGMMVRRDGWIPSWQETFPSGDPKFDASFKIAAKDEAETIAILDDEARAQLFDARTRDIRIEGGRVLAGNLRLPPEQSAEAFIAQAAEACALAEMLRKRRRGADALLRGFRTRATPGARARCLECLVATHGQTEALRDALVEAAESNDPHLQRLAAWGAADAPRRLFATLPPEEAAAELRLLPLCVRRAILARSESLACEPAVLAFLANEGARDIPTRIAVIAILAKCGGPHALEPLRAIAADELPRVNGEPQESDACPVLDAANRAIVLVTARIPAEASPGGVSLTNVPSTAGAVSVSSTGGTGAVSLPKKPGA